MENTSPAEKAATNPHAYVPPTKLDIGEWSARMQDALTDFHDRHTGARITPSAVRPGVQETNARAGNGIGPVGLSVTETGPVCEWCAEPFEARRSSRRFCSDAHRIVAHRAKAAA